MSKSKIKTMLIMFFEIRGACPPLAHTAGYFRDWKILRRGAQDETQMQDSTHLARHRKKLETPSWQVDISFVVIPGLFFCSHFKGQHFRTVDNIKEAYTKALKDVPEKATLTPSMPTHSPLPFLFSSRRHSVSNPPIVVRNLVL